MKNIATLLSRGGKNLLVKKRCGMKLEITPQFEKEVEELAGRRLTNEDIAHYFGVCAGTFNKLLKKTPSLQIAMRRGRARRYSFAVGKLYDLVKEKNLGAITFYLKTQHGWKETIGIENKDLDGQKEQKRVKLTSDPLEASKIYQNFIKDEK